MLGAEFLLQALGLPKEEIDALKQLLEPGNLKRVGADLLARFEAMERRNMEMHAMIMRLAAAPAAGFGDVIPPIFTAEMDRQSQLVLEGALDNDGRSDDRSEGGRGGDYVNGSHFGE